MKSQTFKRISISILLILMFTTASLFNLYCEEKTTLRANMQGKRLSPKMNYVPGEVIVKIKEKEGILIISDQTYSARNEELQGKLNRLKTKYRLRDGKPVFQYLHKKLEERGSNQIQLIGKPKVDLFPIYVLETDQDVFGVCAQLNQDSDVEYAEPNYIAESFYIPNDALYYQQWSHQNTQAEQGWNIEKGSSDVVIAIVDTGVDYNHEDLAANIWHDEDGNPGKDFVDININSYPGYYRTVPGEDYTEIDNEPSDYYGHGTHCAGIAGAVGGNSIGVTGVAPECTIMPVRAGFVLRDVYLGELGLFEYDDIVNAVHYATDNGADVISMSFGGPADSQVIRDAMDYAYENGVVLVAAAGNSNNAIKNYPAAYENVVAVASTGITDRRAYYSSYGSYVDVVAPGGDKNTDNMILSTVPTVGTLSDPSGYRYLQGTSMACPYAAGVAVLIKSLHTDWSNILVKNQLINTTDSLYDENPAYVGMLGSGRVNVFKVLTTTPEVKLIISDTAFSESGGDGFIDPGDTVEVDITLKSIWLAAESIVATLETDDGYITITNAVNDYGNLASDETTTRRFSFYVSLQTPRPHKIPLVLSVDTENGNTQNLDLSFNITSEDEWSLHEGWPVAGEGGARIADLDSDGEAEIVTLGGDNLDVFRNDGTKFPGDWPKTRSEPYYFSSYIAVGDLDNDGDKEIIVIKKDHSEQNTCKIYAFHHDGSDVAGWPFDTVMKVWETGSPTVGDVDSDSMDEVVVNIGGYLYLLKGDGTVFSDAWPKFVGQPEGGGTAALADIDMNGELDIICGTTDGIDVVDINGNELPGWAFQKENEHVTQVCAGDVDNDGFIEIVYITIRGLVQIVNKNGGPKYQSPWPITTPARLYSLALSDLDNDGDLEILCGGMFTTLIYAFHHDGTNVDGWPLSANSYTGVASTNLGGIGDLNGDGYKEVTVSSDDGVYIFNHDGTPAFDTNPILARPGFSRTAAWYFPAIGDIDSDNMAELVGYSGNNIYCWDFTGDIIQADWPLYAHDVGNTSCWKDIIPPTVTITSPQDGGIYNFSIDVEGTAEDIVSDIDSVTVCIDGDDIAVVPVTDGTFEYQLTNLTEGFHDLAVKAQDKAGNEGSDTVSFRYVKIVKSTIYFIWPSKGRPGDYFIIFGNNFGPLLDSSKVKFFTKQHSEYAEIIFWSDYYIVYKVPDLKPGNYRLAVVNLAGESRSKPFTVLPPKFHKKKYWKK